MFLGLPNPPRGEDDGDDGDDERYSSADYILCSSSAGAGGIDRVDAEVQSLLIWQLDYNTYWT